MFFFLIVNPCGLLSALVPENEFGQWAYMTEGLIVGKVECEQALFAKIRGLRGQVRVLMPELPPPIPGENWYYIAVINGVLRAV